MARGVLTTVTHDDGTISKRTSVSRRYTHAIECGPQDAVKYAAFLERNAALLEKRANYLMGAVNVGNVVIRSRGFIRPGQDGDVDRTGAPYYHNYEAILKGSAAKSLGLDYERTTHCNSKGETYSWNHDNVVSARDQLLASVAHDIERMRADSRKARVEAAGLLDGSVLPDTAYTVVRWSSRLDAAEKALGSFSYLAESGHTLKVVAVD